MASKCVLSMEEKNGVKHLASVTWEDCGCDKIVCEHGYSSRFIYCIMIQKGIRFGGNGEESIINLEDLFTDLNPYNVSQEPITPEYSPEVKPAEWIPIYKEPVELLSKLEDKDNIIEKLNTRLSEVMKSKKYDVESLGPGDSSSQIGRYKKNFMSGQTIYTVNPKGKTILTVIEETDSNFKSTDVVKGFMKTPEIKRLESKSINQIAPINGLSNPFKNHRLNLLCHFNTALGTFKPPRSNKDKSAGQSLFDSMRQLLKYSAVTPSEELAYQIIVRTFDIDKRMVVANPFRLPFIEVGMSISDDSLNKCFSLLDMEYEMLWFSEMKSLKVPGFHDAFDQYKENKLTTLLKAKQPASNQREQYTSKRSSSVLSIR